MERSREGLEVKALKNVGSSLTTTQRVDLLNNINSAGTTGPVEEL
jgi:hypothetical protein